jgi:hypothetical protein
MVSSYSDSLRLTVVSVPIPLHGSLPEYPVARGGNGSMARREVCSWCWTALSSTPSRVVIGRYACRSIFSLWWRLSPHWCLTWNYKLLYPDRDVLVLREYLLCLNWYVLLRNECTQHGYIVLLNEGSSRSPVATTTATVGRRGGEGRTEDYCCGSTNDDAVLGWSGITPVLIIAESTSPRRTLPREENHHDHQHNQW